MIDLAEIRDLFEHDQLVNDFEFAKRLYDSEINAFEKYTDEDKNIIWGDLIG
jgi:hypothetical protein